MGPILPYLLPFLSGTLLALGALWMKNPFFKLAERSVGLLNILVADIDENEKFELVNTKVMQTVGSLLVVLLMATLVVAGAIALYTGLIEYIPFEPSGYGMLLLAVGSVVPFLIPKKKKSAYSAMAQLFHHLVLDNYHLGKKLLNYQIKGVAAESQSDRKYSRVLITGLARAGTTALTKELAKRGPFASLDYGNMPVLLAPKLWAKFYKPKRIENKERAHGDGVKVGLASVEALEEYFFKVIKDDSYIKEDGLYQHELSEEENELYRRYQNSIAGNNIYLAKNNNAVLRLESLTKHNPDLAVFLLVRDPLQHAYSLMQQHKKFSAQQEGDPFIKDYMDWLGHHEFGSGQRPFVLNGVGTQNGDPNDINYWLERWMNYYSQVSIGKNTFALTYEDFLAEPKLTLTFISSTLGISVNLVGTKNFDKNPVSVGHVNEALLSDANALYKKLTSRCPNLSS